MITSYIKLALRNLIKQRLYAFINIVGLTIGLCVFLFASILVRYESNHDNMFSEHNRIYTVSSIFASTSGSSISEIWNIRTAYGPLFDLEIKELEQVARAIQRERIISVENDHYYQSIRFVDSGFTRIFDFKYMHGDKTAIDDPLGLIVTESTAIKLFGHTEILGEVITLDHRYDMHIAAVIEDLAADSHFNFSLLPGFKLTAIASIQTLVALDDFELAGEWKTLRPYDLTYILLPENRDKNWLQDQVNTVSDRHAPEDEFETIKALKIKNLTEANTGVWEALGFPVLGSVQLLGLLILIISTVNYVNLATAQSLGRSREIGLRKTLGAERSQLLTQFLIESLTITAFAMLLAVSGIELLIPAYNGWTGKAVTLNYLSIFPWLIFTTIIVGLVAGAYPAYMITRQNPIDSLRNVNIKSRKGSFFRSSMITVQFSISIFMLAMVMTISSQNNKVEEMGNEFPKSQIVLLERVDENGIQNKHETLRQEFNNIGDTQGVAFSNGAPFISRGGTQKVTPIKGDESLGFDLRALSIDFEFMDVYNIDLLAGRSFKREIANDMYNEDVEQINVIVNQLTAKKLGFDKAENAIGHTFHQLIDGDNIKPREYRIVGLVADQYFLGVTSDIVPMVFLIRPELHNFASIKVNQNNLSHTLTEIDSIWSRVIENQPIRRTLLEFHFNTLFRILEAIKNVLSSFAIVALSLALIGLFGLAAFIAQRRTKEIGIRKIMGANTYQIIRLLLWQFSLPVIWSMLFAVPLAYFASKIYLDFFPERIDFVIPIILLACLISIFTAWIVVVSNTISIARAKPIKSLRYE